MIASPVVKACTWHSLASAMSAGELAASRAISFESVGLESDTILNSATFVGCLVAGPSGALLATFAIFAPSFAMTLVFTGLFAHIRHLGPIRGAIRGVMSVFFGLLAGVTLSLGQQALTQPMAFVFAAAALVALRYLKWDIIAVLAGGLLAWGGWYYLEATIGKL